jgi:hypothetical protein
MQKGKYFPGLAAAIGMLVCILDTKTAISGASDGLQLCIRTVIPSLLPFFILSSQVMASLMGASFRYLGALRRILKIPKGAEAILAAAFLGGYPVGAQTIGDAVRSRSLPADVGARLLAFCNNAGPAFLFGIGSVLFPKLWICWALWGIHILSAALVSLFFPAKSSICGVIEPQNRTTLPITAALRAMAHVCGWIILFRVILSFWERWFGWMLPPLFSMFITGLLELSLGCISLGEIPCIGLRFVLFSSLLGFGGLCVMLQSRTASHGVDFRFYIPGKLLHGMISFSISALVQYLLPAKQRWNLPIYVPVSFVCILITVLFLSRRENLCGNPRVVRV